MGKIEIQKKWYKTVGGIIFLVIFGLAAIMIIVFTSFFSSYLIQIRYGDADKLERQFNPRFTVDPSLTGVPKGVIIEESIDKLIHDYSPVFGNLDAPVTLFAFIDFECPFSQEAYSVFAEVIKKYEPAIKVVFKHFPVESLHPGALKSATAAQCAQEQNKFWEYHNLLFERNDYTEESLLQYGEELGLNVQQLKYCMEKDQFNQDVVMDIKDGIDIGVRGTPTYIINNKKIEGVLSSEAWDKIILEAIK